MLGCLQGMILAKNQFGTKRESCVFSLAADKFR